MANRKMKYTLLLPAEVQIHVAGVPFSVDRELLASKSAKVAALLKENPRNDLSSSLRDIPADAATFEMVARFCHGYEVNISTENVIGIAVLAQYLGMTEKHCSNNLLRQALYFFEHQILPSWNKSIAALKSAEHILQHAVHLGLVDGCVESIIRMAQQNPYFLGEPFKNSTPHDDDFENGNREGENVFRSNVRRKLFTSEGKSEDLTGLPLELYGPIIQAMIQRQVPLEFVCASIYQYVRRWVLSSMSERDERDDGGSSICKRKSQREIIETVERLLPDNETALPCTYLFEMLHSAIALDSSMECRNGFEVRIGKKLEQASVRDLLMHFQGCGKEEKFYEDTECLKRILQNFYHNCDDRDSGLRGLIAVSELLDRFLAEIASDTNLRVNTFISLAELVAAASAGAQHTSDFIYRALDLFLDKHRYLSESEREEVCQVLDCSKMSAKACEHAAQNSNLPMRIVVQVLFASQLKLRDSIITEVHQEGLHEVKLLKKSPEEEENIDEAENGSYNSYNSNNNSSSWEEEVRMKVEMEKMSSKVLELEKECHTIRRELSKGSHCCRRRSEAKIEKTSMWKEVKRKFGCISFSSMSDCNCHARKKTKVHPK